MSPIEQMHPPILEQMEAYRSMKEELEQKYPGRWVIIHERQIQGNYDSFESAEEAAEAMGLHPMIYLVKQVGVEPLIIIPAWTTPA